MTPDCAAGAQGRRETCELTAKYRRSATGLAQGLVPLDPGLRACGAQGHRETCELAVKIPPLGDRPRGSLVRCGFLVS